MERALRKLRDASVSLKGEPSIGDTHASSIKWHFRSTLPFPIPIPRKSPPIVTRISSWNAVIAGNTAVRHPSRYPPRCSPSSTPNGVFLCNAKATNGTCCPLSPYRKYGARKNAAGKNTFLYCDLHTENFWTCVTLESHSESAFRSPIRSLISAYIHER